MLILNPDTYYYKTIQDMEIQNKKYTIFCNAIPASGHILPLLKMAEVLHKRGHRIIYSTAQYEVQKIKTKYPNFTYVSLQNTINTPQGLPHKRSNDVQGEPPLQYFYKPWINEIKEAAQQYKPDLFFVDTFSIAAIQVAEQLNIKVIINFPMLLQVLTIFGLVDVSKNFGFLGLNVIKPNPIAIIFKRLCYLVKNLNHNLINHLVIVHSFFGLDRPLTLPPNIKTIGLCYEKAQTKQLDSEIKNWLLKIQEKKLEIIYVTFGSHVTATQQFVDYLYYGLKKTGKAVIWSLRKNKIPENNELFYVRQWLPQKDLLKLNQIKVVITHCGYGGVTECIDAEKPMLCMPVFGDQPLNAERIESLGMGLILRPMTLPMIERYEKINYKHQQLIFKVNRIMSSEQFKNKIKSIKKIGEKYRGIIQGCQIIEQTIQNGYQHLVDKSLIKVVDRDPMRLARTLICGLGLAILFVVGRKVKDIFGQISKPQ